MGMDFLAPNFCGGSSGRGGGEYEDKEEYKNKSNINDVQKIKTGATIPKEISVLTLQVKVFFLHVYLWRAFIAFCCSSAVPNVKWSHGLPLLGDRI